mgnify:CR=1 FL=1
MTCPQRFNSENGTEEQEQEQANAIPLTSLQGFQQAAANSTAANASSQHRPLLSEQREALMNIIDLVLDLLDEDDFLDLYSVYSQ